MNASLLQSERMGKSPTTSFARMLESLCGRQKGWRGERRGQSKLVWPYTSEVGDFTFTASQPTETKRAITHLGVSVVKLKESENKNLNKINEMGKQSQPGNYRWSHTSLSLVLMKYVIRNTKLMTEGKK